jgi:hypothetical protein
MVIEPRRYGLTISFFEGVACVAVSDGENAKWGCIDKTGKYVWEPSD